MCGGVQAGARLMALQLELSGDTAAPTFEASHAAAHAWLAAAPLPRPLAAQLALHCAALQALHLLRRGHTAQLVLGAAPQRPAPALRGGLPVGS